MSVCLCKTQILALFLPNLKDFHSIRDWNTSVDYAQQKDEQRTGLFLMFPFHSSQTRTRYLKKNNLKCPCFIKEKQSSEAAQTEPSVLGTRCILGRTAELCSARLLSYKSSSGNFTAMEHFSSPRVKTWQVWVGSSCPLYGTEEHQHTFPWALQEPVGLSPLWREAARGNSWVCFLWVTQANDGVIFRQVSWTAVTVRGIWKRDNSGGT